MLSYGDTILCDPTLEQRLWVEHVISPSDVYDFARDVWPTKEMTGMAFPGAMRARAVKANSLFWPTGASRFSVAYVFATDAQLADIRTQILPVSSSESDLTGPPQPLDFVIDDGRQSVTVSLYMLPPRPLAQIPTPVPGLTPPTSLNGLWLLTLVDARYWWWYKAASLEVPTCKTLASATVASPGTGYSVGNVLTLVGGTFSTAAQVTISAIGMSTQSVANGGTGYVAGAVMTVVGGTFTTPATLQVATTTGGAVTSAAILDIGAYTVPPTSPVSVTGGGGVGATFSAVFSSVSTVSVTRPGCYTVLPSNPVSVTGGSGSSATLNAVWTKPWEAWLQSIAAALGITLSIDPIPDSYLNPPTDLTCRNDPLPILLDSSAYSVGLRLVANLDGTYKLQAATNATAAYTPQITDFFKRSGGTINLDAANPNTDVFESLPNAVNVAFPITRHTFPNCPPFISNQPLSGLTIPELAPIQTLTLNGTKPFRSTAAPGYSTSGTILNGTELNALAKQIATDFYRWQLGPLDIQFVGAVPYAPEALHDIEWTHNADSILCRVQRLPWNDLVTDLLHAGTFGSNVVADVVATVQLNSSGKTGHYYDGFLTTYNPTTDLYTTRQPCWLKDPSGTASLSPGSEYPGCTLSSGFQGRPVYSLPVQAAGGGGGGSLTVNDLDAGLSVPNVTTINVGYGEVEDVGGGGATLGFSGMVLSIVGSGQFYTIAGSGQIVWHVNQTATDNFWQSPNFATYQPGTPTQDRFILPCGGLYFAVCQIAIDTMGTALTEFELQLVADGINGPQVFASDIRNGTPNLCVSGIAVVPGGAPGSRAIWATAFQNSGSTGTVVAGTFSVIKVG